MKPTGSVICEATLIFSGATISQRLIQICDRVVDALRGIEGAGRLATSQFY